MFKKRIFHIYFCQGSGQIGSVHGLNRILYSYWLAHFHLMKKSAIVQLNFGLGCGMMEFFTFKPQSKEHDVSPAFMEYGLAKKIAA
jgi:hypothetical protein